MNKEISISVSSSGEKTYNGHTIEELLAVLTTNTSPISKIELENAINFSIEKNDDCVSLVMFLYNRNISIIYIIKIFMVIFNLSMIESNEIILTIISSNNI
jgi:hypothetical protein